MFLANSLPTELPLSLEQSMELLHEKDPSTWSTALHIDNDGFVLRMRYAFQDASSLRYGWTINNSTARCI